MISEVKEQRAKFEGSVPEVKGQRVIAQRPWGLRSLVKGLRSKVQRLKDIN